MMNKEGSFPRLLELIQGQKSNSRNGGAGLHRLLLDLLYEMSRIQRLKIEDLGEFLQLDSGREARGRFLSERVGGPEIFGSMWLIQRAPWCLGTSSASG